MGKWNGNIPTYHIVWDEESCPPLCKVIDDDTGNCIASFEDVDEATEWANRNGYDRA